MSSQSSVPSDISSDEMFILEDTQKYSHEPT